MSLLYTDQRITALTDWLRNSLSLDIKQLEAASSDASFRRYFRIGYNDIRQIVMDAPPEKENIRTFIRVAELFKTANLRIPDIYRQNIDQGFLLLEDFGSICLLDSLNAENADGLYRQALNSLLKLQTGIDINNCGLPPYDMTMLDREIGIFHEWFLEKLLGVVLPTAIDKRLRELLIDSALQQPQVCVHRDFHSRNLMIVDKDSPGIIDFQDAVVGPICYDPVSLLRDCYIRWPKFQVEQWTQVYYQQLLNADLLKVDFQQFNRWFDLMGLQRHLKAIGIFARLHLRDGKSTDLADIPRTFGYVIEICEAYPELAEINHFLHRQVLPIYRAAL